MFDQETIDFIKEIGSKEYIDGCAYKYLDNNLAIVFGMNSGGLLSLSDGLLSAKIAYNCDDLQCDYDIDWLMPVNSDGDVIDTEFVFYRDQNLNDELEAAIDTLEYNYNLCKKLCIDFT